MSRETRPKHLVRLVPGKHLVIVGENDDAGRLGAEQVAAGLVGIAASVKIIYPPDCAKDLREWYTAPAGCNKAEVLSVIRKTEPFEPDAAPGSPTSPQRRAKI